jgi:hypothetical protein
MNMRWVWHFHSVINARFNRNTLSLNPSRHFKLHSRIFQESTSSPNSLKKSLQSRTHSWKKSFLVRFGSSYFQSIRTLNILQIILGTKSSQRLKCKVPNYRLRRNKNMRKLNQTSLAFNWWTRNSRNNSIVITNNRTIKEEQYLSLPPECREQDLNMQTMVTKKVSTWVLGSLTDIVKL